MKSFIVINPSLPKVSFDNRLLLEPLPEIPMKHKISIFGVGAFPESPSDKDDLVQETFMDQYNAHVCDSGFARWGGDLFNGVASRHLKVAGISRSLIMAFQTYKLESKKTMKKVVPLALLVSGWSIMYSPNLANAKQVPVDAFLTGSATNNTNISFTYEFTFNHNPESSSGAGLFSLNQDKKFGNPSPIGQINTLGLPKIFSIDDSLGHGSQGLFSLDYQVGSLNDGSRPWSIWAQAFAKQACIKNKDSCGEIIAKAKIKAALAVEKEAITIFSVGQETKIPKVKDPTYSLSLNDFSEFFSVSLFRDPLTDLVDATYYFGSVPDPFSVSLDYNGVSCELSTCSANAAFLSQLSSISRSDNWDIDPNGDYIANKDIALPGVTVNQPATLRAGLIQEDSGVEVPGPLPLLGVAAAFGYSRKLRKRIKGNKTLSLVGAID
jgi:hypothetical protein